MSSSDPADILRYVRAADRDELFQCAVMLSRLCQDPIARQEPAHRVLHRGFGLSGCADASLIAATQRSLGLSDQHAAFLIAQLDGAVNQLSGLTGG